MCSLCAAFCTAFCAYLCVGNSYIYKSGYQTHMHALFSLTIHWQDIIHLGASVQQQNKHPGTFFCCSCWQSEYRYDELDFELNHCYSKLPYLELYFDSVPPRLSLAILYITLKNTWISVLMEFHLTTCLNREGRTRSSAQHRTCIPILWYNWHLSILGDVAWVPLCR